MTDDQEQDQEQSAPPEGPGDAEDAAEETDAGMESAEAEPDWKASHPTSNDVGDQTLTSADAESAPADEPE